MGARRRLRDLETRVAALETAVAPPAVSHDMPPRYHLSDPVDAQAMWREVSDVLAKARELADEPIGVYL